MPRTYTLKRRAERQAETRLRIVEAAVALHGSLGPARTPLSLVAERAGVQRHTLYAHFPDERSLLLACSGLATERDPPPDPVAWREGPDRLRAGLGAIYGWYRRNEQLAACVLRDAEVHAPTREVTELRLGPTMRRWEETLGAPFGPLPRAVLRVMLGFAAWRSLSRDSALGPGQVVEAAIRAIQASAGSDTQGRCGPLPPPRELL